MKHFKGNELHLPKKIPLRTNEGPKAYQGINHQYTRMY